MVKLKHQLVICMAVNNVDASVVRIDMSEMFVQILY